MSQPNIAQKGPFPTTVEAGKTYYWCSCGQSQHQPGQEIPEKHWMYRLAKKHYFFGFGAYG